MFFLSFALIIALSAISLLWTQAWFTLIWMVMKTLFVLIPLGVFTLYLILAERKIMAYMQDRVGPNRVGPLGSMQTIADGLKFLFKEVIIPEAADRRLFLLAPVMSLVPAFGLWSVIPVDVGWVVADVDAGVLFLLAMSSIGAYGVIIAGWSSNSKYALFSAIRCMAQIISYEITIGFSLVAVLMLTETMNLQNIVLYQSGGIIHWLFIPLFPIFVVFCVSALAEVNRPPFDVVEGESEIVAGYQVEYSGFAFAMFFVAEYCNMILVSAVAAILFLGGWLSPFIGIPVLEGLFNWVPGSAWFFLKIAFFLWAMVWVRSTFPRYRYDQVMMLCWKVLIPVAFVWIVVLALVLRAY